MRLSVAFTVLVSFCTRCDPAARPPGTPEVSVDVGTGDGALDPGPMDGTVPEVDLGPVDVVDAGDVVPFDPATATCEALSLRFDELVESFDRSCGSPADCDRIGGTQTCECAPTLGTATHGIALNGAARATNSNDGELRAVEAAFQTRCFRNSSECSLTQTYPCWCDAAPGTPSCVDGACGTVVLSGCF